MGVTAHFYDAENHQRRVVGLALRSLSERHTGDYIFTVYQEMIAQWGIEDKIFKVVTDNGSNVVKAFKDICQIENERVVELDVTNDANIIAESSIDPNLEEEFEFDDDEFEEPLYATYFSTTRRKRLSKFTCIGKNGLL